MSEVKGGKGTARLRVRCYRDFDGEVYRVS